MTEFGSISARLVGSEDEDAPQVVASASVDEENSRQDAPISGEKGREGMEKEGAKITTFEDLKEDEVEHLMKFLTAEDVMVLGQTSVKWRDTCEPVLGKKTKEMSVAWSRRRRSMNPTDNHWRRWSHPPSPVTWTCR